jgi:hypothetical protein
MTQTELQEAAPTASSEPAADFKKSLMDQVRAAGGTQAVDTKQLFQKLVKETLEALLELEMEEHLGYAKHDPAGRGSGNSRNGASGKTVRGDFGEIEIETPRDRNSRAAAVNIRIAAAQNGRQTPSGPSDKAADEYVFTRFPPVAAMAGSRPDKRLPSSAASTAAYSCALP